MASTCYITGCFNIFCFAFKSWSYFAAIAYSLIKYFSFASFQHTESLNCVCHCYYIRFSHWSVNTFSQKEMLNPSPVNPLLELMNLSDMEEVIDFTHFSLLKRVFPIRFLPTAISLQVRSDSTNIYSTDFCWRMFSPIEVWSVFRSQLYAIPSSSHMSNKLDSIPSAISSLVVLNHQRTIVYEWFIRHYQHLYARNMMSIIWKLYAASEPNWRESSLPSLSLSSASCSYRNFRQNDW